MLYGAFALLPIGIILRHSLSGANALRSPLLRKVVANTIEISATTTLISTALGFLLAIALWRATKTLKTILLAFVLLPFWTAVLIKNFAWAALLQDNGLINTALLETGLITHPITLLHNRFAIITGMVHYVLPYAVFPILTSLNGIDPALERAARSLGAKPNRVTWHVILPLSLPGLAAAALLTFIVSSGFFITPVILGAPSDMMIANLVDYYVHQLVDFDGAAMLGLLILAALIPAIILQQRLSRDRLHGTT